MKGYRGIGPEEGVFVKEEDAYQYALARCLYGPEKEEFREMLVHWFFSGNFVTED